LLAGLTFPIFRLRVLLTWLEDLIRSIGSGGASWKIGQTIRIILVSEHQIDHGAVAFVELICFIRMAASSGGRSVGYLVLWSIWVTEVPVRLVGTHVQIDSPWRDLGKLNKRKGNIRLNCMWELRAIKGKKYVQIDRLVLKWTRNSRSYHWGQRVFGNTPASRLLPDWFSRGIQIKNLGSVLFHAQERKQIWQIGLDTCIQVWFCYVTC
jgi:hypothetical protein